MRMMFLAKFVVRQLEGVFWFSVLLSEVDQSQVADSSADGFVVEWVVTVLIIFHCDSLCIVVQDQCTLQIFQATSPLPIIDVEVLE